MSSSDDPAMGARPGPVAEVVGITKRFGALTANDSISFAVHPGEVHALLGENGAGKSTLTRILYGLSQPDEGEIRVGGRTLRFNSPKDALRAGIGMVTQEFSLVGPMTVTDNVMLGNLGLGPVDRREGRRRVVETAARLGFHVDPDATIESLSVGEQQRVEILKALDNDCRLLILDEPTAVLVPQDVAALFDTIRRLRSDGVGVVFISHKLREVVEIADRVTVLRRGRLVATQPAAGLDPRRIAALMIGVDSGDVSADLDDDEALDEALAIAIADEDLAAEAGVEVGDERAPVHPATVAGDVSTRRGPPADDVASVTPAAAEDAVASVPPAGAAGVDGPGVAGQDPVAPVLRLTDVTAVVAGRPVLTDISFELWPGEIVGVAGVSGNGQTELVDVLAGTLRPDHGEIEVGGRSVTALGPLERLRAGLGRISENRKASVVPTMTVAQTLVLEDLHRFSSRGFTRRGAVRRHADELIEQFDIRARPDDPISSLSGGNMQKVLLARALARSPVALVAAQPTRGLDVGACEFVYRQLRSRREQGSAVLVISDDLDELFALVDRFLVMVGGRIVGGIGAAEASPEQLGLMMMGEVPA